MKEIVNEYGEYILSFLAAIGILAFLFIMVDTLRFSLNVFLDSLC